MIAKVLWRVYHKQALLAIELLKKEDKDKMLKIFGQRGELQEWAEKKGIKLKYTKLEVFPEENELEGVKEETPAEAVGLKKKLTNER